MSYFDKLLIQGVRSFGPKEENRQQVRFDSPLTIIVGRNGCGKTTVIESLRYITTGEFPPGAKGTQFVHDPKIANETETKAQVRLKFRDIAAKPVTVTRNMQVCQKKSKSEFKTIESVISRLDEDGKAESSMSNKCADIDKEMSICLGVSKAVLNNVIFCHQEEFNWPLDDCKSVKTKFDDIFAASRYIKAMDELKKVRKDRSAKAKQYETEAQYLKDNKDKFKELTELAKVNQTKLNDLNNRIESINDERQVNDVKCSKLSLQLKQFNELVAKKNALSTSCAEKKYRIEELASMLDASDSLFTGSDTELNRSMEQHEEMTKSRKDKANELSDNIRSLNSEIERLVSNVDTQKLELGEIKTQLALYEKDRGNRDSVINCLAKQFGIRHYSSTLSDSDVEIFKKEMNAKLIEADQNKENKRRIYAEKELKLQEMVDKCMLELNQIEETIRREKREIIALEKSQDTFESQLKEIRKSGNQITELKRLIEDSKVKLVNHEKSLDLREVEKNRDRTKLKIEENETRLKQLGSELSIASRNTALMETIRHLKSGIESREATNSRIISKREDDLTTVMGELPSSNLKQAVSKVLNMKSTELSALNKSVNEKNVKLESLKYRKNAVLDSLKDKENEKGRLEREMDFPSTGYDTEIETLTEAIKEIQDKIGFLRGSSSVYSHYCAKLKDKSPKCPVCFRGFEAVGSGTTAKDAIDRLVELKNRVPSSLKSEEQKLTTKESQLKKLYDNKHLYTQYESLSKDIPDLKLEVETVSSEIMKVSSEIENEQQNLDFVYSDVTILQESIADLSEWDRNEEELVDFRKKLSVEEEKLSLQGKTRPLNDIEKEKTCVESQTETLKMSLNESVLKLDSYQKMKTKLQEESLKLEQKLLDLTSINQKADQITDKIDENDKKIKQLTKNVEYSETRVDPLTYQLNTAKNEKSKLMKEKDSIINELSAQQMETSTKLKQIADLTAKLLQFNESDKTRKYNEIETSIAKLESQWSASRDSLTAKQKELESIKEEISRELLQKRAYEDNLNLRLMIQEKDKLMSDLSKMEEQIKHCEEGSLKKEYEKLLQVADKLSRDFHQTTGQCEELGRTVETLNKQLNHPLYKEASQKWTKMVTEWKSNKLASVDLDKFSKALDSALMRFHSLKMSEINQILSQLWREVYTGRDIDTIEIRTEEGENTTQTRKTYNYRVVMTKEGVELDMRGRCSAGQKVLASLLIRLALADTFCLQCGVFSLDEPTTNLDRENIASLAEALVQIIRNRHKNSQFVIITHDMDFVELLGNAELVEYYHEVTRDSLTGLSIITRKSIREMENN